MYEIRIVPACLTTRLGAWLIDSAISIGLIAASMHKLAGTADVEAFVLQTTYLQLGLVALIPYVAHVVFAGIKQCTPGMYVMDLQLLTADGELPEWSNAMRRPLGLLFLLASGFLTALIPALNDQRRTLADYISGTRVVESLALGTRISYDAWRVFRKILKPMAPASLAVAIAILLLNKEDGANKAVLLNAVVIATTGTILVATLVAGIKVKISRVRLSPQGIQRSGWLGWSHTIIPWNDIDFARVRPKRLLPYFELRRLNRRRFRVPLEGDSAQYTATALQSNGVRLEQ